MYLKVMTQFKFKILLASLLFIGQLVADTPAHQILNYPFSNRSAGMGGTRAADPSGALDINGNPATSSFVQLMAGQFGVINHLVGIRGYSAMGVIPMDRHRLSAELIYFDFGQFERTDVFGNNQSTFGFHELASSLGYAFIFSDKVRLGARVGRYLQVADSQSKADLYYDLGAVYHNQADSLTVGLYLAGLPLGDPGESFPTELRIGSSKILSHLPLRLNVDGIYAFNQQFHFALGGEILIHPQFRVRLGLNSNRFDLQTGVTESDFIAGMSGGFAINSNRLLIEMAGQSFGAAGWVSQLSISFHL